MEGKNDIKQREHQFRKSKHYIKIVIFCKLTPSKRVYVKQHLHYMKRRDKKGKNKLILLKKNCSITIIIIKASV
jgi:hypothetical protein